MIKRLCIHTALIAIILLTAATASGQKQLATGTQPQPATPADQPVDVVYTGRLLGYYRVPSLQSFNAVNGCPAENQLEPSKAAKQFLDVRNKQDKNKTVLVGTGDNFAPQLEARVFSDVTATGNQYAIGNKELYLGSNTGWTFYKADTPASELLRDRIAQGHGVIPNDNVACFLRRAKYAAIVPGKHDFYFGAERVRQFARFLAKPASGEYDAVQMLGANLVIKTDSIVSMPVSAKVKAEKTFDNWPSAYPVLNLNDGKRVYPWFSLIKIELADIPSEAGFLKDLKNLTIRSDADLTTFIGSKTVKLDTDITTAKAIKTDPSAVSQMEADKKRLSDLASNLQAIRRKPIRICTTDGHPNDLSTNCDDPDRTQLKMIGNKMVLHVYLKPKFKGPVNHSTLLPGKNHFLCTTVTVKKTGADKDACLRFSTYTPFFTFPHDAPNRQYNGYVDPEPYIVKNNVAVFGVVDPMLSEQVGILNLGWVHERDNHPELTSSVSAEDPLEALQQQLEYFEIKYPNFSGMMVLLAQMAPQRARALAAKFPQFQVVVASADQEQATSTVTASRTWKPGGPANDTFLAVPSPYFDSSTQKGSVHYGIINAAPNGNDWQLNATAVPGDEVVVTPDPAQSFWARIKELPGCLQSGFQRNPNNESYGNQTYLKWLVLCAMQQHLGADVALIQTRDLFGQILELEKGSHTRSKMGLGAVEDPENVQQTLDRLIWKGDLVSLVYVPGSALKKALEKSNEFKNQEEASLLLSVEKGRTLETLGIRLENGEVFINELPLDNNRLYAIATTDYIGAGDTGYPDLRNSARNPRSHPAAYSDELISISTLVCRKYFSNNPSLIPQYCLEAVDGARYLDETIAAQVPPYPPEDASSRFWKATGFAWINKRTPDENPEQSLEHRVQRRTFRGFSLKNLSIGFKDLDNNRTDESLKDKFAGIPTSGVGSKENRNISFGLDTRFSQFADRHEYFLGLGIDYDRQSTGDPTRATGISLNKNRIFLDGGLALWRRAGRDLPNLAAVFSLHGETQLERPFSAFNLNTEAQEQIRIPQKRGALLLARIGVSWKNRTNVAEVGVQYGREFRALRGYRFDNEGDNDPECLVNATQTLEACINEKSGAEVGTITANSTPSALLEGRPRAGIYWNHTFSFPLWSKVKYEVTQDADFFFVKFHEDTSIDTRFRFNSKNSLRFMIWPNFSIGPVMDLFMYQNKLNRNFLFQRTFGIETKLNFDVFNRREKKAQIISRE